METPMRRDKEDELIDEFNAALEAEGKAYEFSRSTNHPGAIDAATNLGFHRKANFMEANPTAFMLLRVMPDRTVHSVFEVGNIPVEEAIRRAREVVDRGGVQ